MYRSSGLLYSSFLTTPFYDIRMYSTCRKFELYMKKGAYVRSLFIMRKVYPVHAVKRTLRWMSAAAAMRPVMVPT